MDERPELTKEKSQIAFERWSKMPGSSALAATQEGKDWVKALGIGWYEQDGSFRTDLPDDSETFEKLITTFNEAVPEMRLLRPEAKQPPKLPQLWKIRSLAKLSECLGRQMSARH